MPKVTDTIRQQILQLHRGGASSRAIAKSLSVSRGSVLWITKKSDPPSDPPSDPRLPRSSLKRVVSKLDAILDHTYNRCAQCEHLVGDHHPVYGCLSGELYPGGQGCDCTLYP